MRRLVSLALFVVLVAAAGCGNGKCAGGEGAPAIRTDCAKPAC